MSTVRTCTTPVEGWLLCNHCICRVFLILTELEGDPVDPLDSIGSKRREMFTDDLQTQLVGNLYRVVRRMEKYLHYGDATKMSLILDMVVELDITDPGNRARILREFQRARRSPAWMSDRDR